MPKYVLKVKKFGGGTLNSRKLPEPGFFYIDTIWAETQITIPQKKGRSSAEEKICGLRPFCV